MTPDLSNLRYFVLCKSTQAFFETIVGFDCKPPALNYARGAQAANHDFDYRVVDAEGREVTA